MSTANANNIDRPFTVDDALVDTGATWTALPRALADQLELPIIGQTSGIGAGGRIALDQSYTWFELNGKRGVGPVVISDTLSDVLVGVLTLESLALGVDPLNQRLIETELYLL